jgi:hypothetical protein
MVHGSEIEKKNHMMVFSGDEFLFLKILKIDCESDNEGKQILVDEQHGKNIWRKEREERMKQTETKNINNHETK